MTDELVAYLLDDLCPQRRAEVERRLKSDAVWQQELERLKECLAATGDPEKCAEEPPRDLVKRTCGCVERARKRDSAAVAAPVGVAAAAPWSFADMSVGGGILVLLGMLMLPAMRDSRDATRRLVCQSNLKTLGTALFKFQENHGGWLPPVSPGESSVQYVLALANHVGIDPNELARVMACPDSPLGDQVEKRRNALELAARDEFAQLPRELQARVLENLAGSYASRIGYLDERGQYHHVKYTAREDQSLLADAPSISHFGIRSFNHGDDGQNVLDESLCVRYRVNCEMAKSLDNIFLNQKGLHDAGCEKNDVVLLRPEYGPGGPAIMFEMIR